MEIKSPRGRRQPSGWGQQLTNYLKSNLLEGASQVIRLKLISDAELTRRINEDARVISSNGRNYISYSVSDKACGAHRTFWMLQDKFDKLSKTNKKKAIYIVNKGDSKCTFQ